MPVNYLGLVLCVLGYSFNKDDFIVSVMRPNYAVKTSVDPCEAPLSGKKHGTEYKESISQMEQ